MNWEDGKKNLTLFYLLFFKDLFLLLMWVIWGKKNMGNISAIFWHCKIVIVKIEHTPRLLWPWHTLSVHIVKSFCVRASCCLVHQLIFKMISCGNSIPQHCILRVVSKLIHFKIVCTFVKNNLIFDLLKSYNRCVRFFCLNYNDFIVFSFIF